MSDLFGINGWGIAVLAVVLGLAVLLAASRLRKRRGHDAGVFAPPEPRLAVLESTMVDAQRRLVLVACDDVEHLILIGGPADLVVDNDVQRQRAGKPAAPSVAEPARVQSAQPPRQEPSAAPEPVLGAPEVAAEPKVVEASRPAKPAEAAKSAEAPARPSAGRPALAAVPAPVPQPAAKSNSAPAPALAMQVGPARPVAPKPADTADAKSAKPKQAVEAQFSRRDPPAPPAAAQAQSAAAAPQPGPKPAELPAAEVPWPDGDSLENEIVKALRVEPKAAAPGPVQQRDAAATAKTAAPATTLGDLADRLEEALAREVQNAGQKGSRLDLGLDAFGFDQSNGGHAAPEAPNLPSTERKPKPESVKAMPSAPEPETRRELRIQPERQEEAPVISLSARRREPVDPLEDEMARLLGELTGDSGRR